MKESSRKTLKDVSEVLRAFSPSDKSRKTCAIIVAAGSSVRMKSDIPKVFLPLCGKPVVIHSIKAFCESAYIDKVTVVCRKGDENVYAEFKKKFNLNKLENVVCGGSSRQESVLKGIEAIEKDKDIRYVAIADGARPLCTPAMIDDCCLNAYRYGAATAAFMATDTVKISEKDNFVDATPPREFVWNAVTPQVFNLNLYRAAAYSALEEGFVTTDDNALVEHIGRKIKLVDVGPYNIKITRPEDLIIAEALLKNRYDKENSKNTDVHSGGKQC